MKNGFIIILAIFFCANLIAEPKVVFNDFDRIDVEYSDYLELKDLAENVAVILIPTFIDGDLHFPEIIDNGDGTYSLNTQPLTSIELNGASYDNSLAQVFDGDGDPANFPGSTLASYSEVGDYYVDTLNYQLYKKIDNDTWGNISTIVFVDSSPVENSSVDPIIGAYYYNTYTGNVFTFNNAWEKIGGHYSKINKGNICENEFMANDPVVYEKLCTGFLIDSKHMVSAGHCFLNDMFTPQELCLISKIVFNHKKDENGALEEIHASDIFNCSELIEHDYVVSGYQVLTDYSVFKLNEDTGRSGLDVDINSSYDTETPLGVIGYPLGTTEKLGGGFKEDETPNATIKFSKYEDSMRFLSDLDLFPGDSGGPVLDLNSMKVIGIVNASPSNFQVRTDFMWNSTDTCLLYNSDPTNHPWASDESVYVKAVYITEALKDNDGDSIHNIEDNCPDIPNPVVSYSLKSEFISGEFGAIANQLGQLGFEFSGFTWRYVYKMQPDSDLDGIGDACDYNSSSGDGFANSRITNIKPQTPSILDSLLLERKYDQYAKINITMPFGSGRESDYCSDRNALGLYLGSTCNAAVHYCAVKHNQKHLWGTRGFCSTSDKEGGSITDVDFGYSHGSDNFSLASRISWRSRISVADSSAGTSFSNWPEFTGSDNPNDDPARKEVTAGYSVFPLKGSENPTIWNWRRDWYEKNNCLRNPTKEICLNIKTAGNYNESHTMYYALSTSILPITSTTQIIPEYLSDNGNAINPDYFPPTNSNVNARAARYSTYLNMPLELNYYKTGSGIPPYSEPLDIPEIEYCPDCYYNIPIRDFINEQGMPEAFSINHIGRWFVGKDENGNYLMSSQQLYFLGEMMFYSEMTEHEMVAVKTVELPATGVTEYQLLLNTSESGAAWEFLGIINNWDSEITSIRTVISTDTGLYFIAGTDSQGQYGQYLFRISVESDSPEITYSLQNLGLTGIGDDTLRDEKLVSIDGNLFVIGADSTGAGTRTFKLTDDASLFEEITGSAPVGRKIYNLKVSGKYIFLTGGMDDNNGSINDLWRFDTESEEWKQIPVSLQGDFRKVITQVVDGKLVMANPVIDGNTTHPAFEINNPAAENVSEITVSQVEIPVTEVEYEASSYCLNETDFVLKGGLEMSGECVPFTHPWYRSFSAGATVYSVAGNGNRLYVGTNGSIKVYDISDSTAMTYISDYSTNGERVYDLEVTADNEMYAATSGGIYRLDISDPDTMTLISNLDTGYYNYQYRIQLYNDLLYVGDDNGINIRDKETFSLISYVDTGAVLDFSISEDEISMYRSTFFSSMIQIRDVDSLNMKAYEYADCYTGELTADHGEFYLSCDGDEYRFEGRTDTYIDFYSLEADMLELQENHVNNGFVYIPDGSSIKLSTNNDVPSLCGNGVIEPGEFCDGNSIACTTLDPDYYGGTAYCNSTCDGYDEDSCETDDGW